jgi:hypothetical protein
MKNYPKKFFVQPSLRQLSPSLIDLCACMCAAICNSPRVEEDESSFFKLIAEKNGAEGGF